MIDHPKRPVADVGLINDQEMQLLVPPQKPSVLEPNGGATDDGFSSVQSVSRLVELQAERTPERIAVS